MKKAGRSGRPVTDLVSRLDYPQLAEDTREVLRTLIAKKREVPAHDGLVITFLDISETKKLAAELEAGNARLRVLQEEAGRGKG